MRILIKFTSLIVLLAFVFVPTRAVAAKGLHDSQIIFGQSFTLESGDSLDGDLVVMGGSATIEQDAEVNGAVVIMGGRLLLDGEVTGDVAVIGGSVTLGATSRVLGNLITVGASLNRIEGSLVDGQIFNTATSTFGEDGNGNHPQLPIQIHPGWNIGYNPFWSVFEAAGQALAFGILAMLVMLFLSSQAGRVAQAIATQPLVAEGIGLLTIFLAPFALLMLTITIILIPVAGILFCVLIAAAVFGWIALGLEIGQRFTKLIKQDWHPSLSAGLGTFTLTLMAYAMTAIPFVSCIGWLVPFLVGLAALGGVIMTRFGMQSIAVQTTISQSAPIVPVAHFIPPEAPASAEPTTPQRKPSTKKKG